MSSTDKSSQAALKFPPLERCQSDFGDDQRAHVQVLEVHEVHMSRDGAKIDGKVAFRPLSLCAVRASGREAKEPNLSITTNPISLHFVEEGKKDFLSC